MARLEHIWRHPIKGHGVEALDRTRLSPGNCLPYDRHWAVAHESARTDGTAWASCANFSRGAKAPQLMAIKAKLDEASETLNLTHPARPPLRFRPAEEEDAFLDWVRPLMPEGRSQSARIVQAPGVAMTDTDYASVSVCSLASLDALSEKAGQALSPLRFRGNLWIMGLEPWEEFDWAGRTLKIGATTMKIEEPIERCRATTANPDTGARDVDTLALLNDQFGHQNFGVYATVISGGEIALGDTAEVL